MDKFEYTVIEMPTKGWGGYKVDFEALTTQLNELGRKGWEVAAMNDTNVHTGSAKGMLIILKRTLTH